MNNSKFNPAKWPINNKNVIYFFTVMLLFFGYKSYNSIPKENFPEIKFPQIIIQTVYPGTSPENMENLVSKPIEDEIKNLPGLKKVTSNSIQDFSIVIAEFKTTVDVDKAKQDVKDAVDKSKKDLPNDLPNEPIIKEVDVSEFPILFVNISGNYSFDKLKKYADLLKDDIESFKEIKRVDVIGAPEKEVRIEPDLYKMQTANIGFSDIQNTIKYENINSTLGNVDINNEKRQLSIKKGFTDVEEIKNTPVTSIYGGNIRIGDIAEVTNGFQKQESFARLYGKNVITLNVIKAGGENLILASDKINARLKELQENKTIPKDLNISVTGDQSDQTRATLHDLINTIIIGFLLVTVILMFFMGIDNAFFVALSVPLSCAIAFMVFPTIGFTLNMIVLFAFLLALGIVVDDAIVVIENTHRIFNSEKLTIKEATLKATEEVFIPVFSGTLTTLMPFVPLAFWQGNIGEFMFFLPITLIITLFASLLVAYLINPVFALDFMKPHEHAETSKTFTRREKIIAVVFIVFAIIFYVTDHIGLGNLTLVAFIFTLLRKYILEKLIQDFQDKFWPKVIGFYSRVLSYSLLNPLKIVFVSCIFFIITIIAFAVRQPKVVFFPDGEPNFAYIYLNLPIGVDQKYTNEILIKLENKIYKTLKIDPKTGEDPNGLISSIISNVTIGATDPQGTEIGNFPNKGKITVSFVKFSERDGKSTSKVLEQIRNCISDVPGAQITVTKESSGPPVSKPIVIEVTGKDLKELSLYSNKLIRYLKNKSIEGIDELRSDFEENKPELVFDYNRDKMNREGISTGIVVQNLRTAVYGMEISRFREKDDEYPINLRLNNEQGQNVDILKNINIVYRDMGKNMVVRQVPISSFVDFKYQNTFGGIKRKNGKRIVTISSEVLQNYNPNEVVAKIQSEINSFEKPQDIDIKMGGEQEEQQETMSFLGNAFLIAFGLMFVIIMMLFNSYRRSIIIMSEIILAIFGVMLGLAITGMEVSIVMSGIGVIALGGIVVRNGILLVEYADVHLKEGKTPYESFMEAGKARMTPVVLTAVATILGLIPLAVGLNIDFVKLFEELNPHIFFGGDNVAFWGPLSWTMIFGLAFGTLLTLILVPVFTLLSLELGKKWFNKEYI